MELDTKVSQQGSAVKTAKEVHSSLKLDTHQQRPCVHPWTWRAKLPDVAYQGAELCICQLRAQS